MRTKSESRRQEIIDVAGEMFLRHGFSPVSISGIASETGITRVTLYNYFSTKEELFEAFVIEAGKHQVSAFYQSGEFEGGDIGDRLKVLGTCYLELILDPGIIAIQRLIIGEAKRFPEMAKIFYERGPRNILLHMAKVLKREILQDHLRQCPPQALALHFMALCAEGMKDRCLWGIDPAPNVEQIKNAVDKAVQAFLLGYGLC